MIFISIVRIHIFQMVARYQCVSQISAGQLQEARDILSTFNALLGLTWSASVKLPIFTDHVSINTPSDGRYDGIYLGPECAKDADGEFHRFEWFTFEDCAIFGTNCFGTPIVNAYGQALAFFTHAAPAVNGFRLRAISVDEVLTIRQSVVVDKCISGTGRVTIYVEPCEGAWRNWS